MKTLLLICGLLASCFEAHARHIQRDVGFQEHYPRPKVARSRQHRRIPEDFAAAARRHAIKLVMERIFRALGDDFPENPNVTIPISDVLPTASTINITTDPCPDIYSKCSSESFLPSCSPPNGTNPRLWNRLYNLYFALPDGLFLTDTLRKATLQIYKNKTLPIDDPTLLNVDLYAYTRNATIRKHFIASSNVSNDYIGWVTLDITDLVSNLRPSNNHGFQIEVKEQNGILWKDHGIFAKMDCSNKDQEFIAIPLGVQPEHQEPKFPTLTVHTGSQEITYLAEQESPSYYYDDELSYKETNLVSPVDTEMSQDDPNTIWDPFVDTDTHQMEEEPLSRTFEHHSLVHDNHIDQPSNDLSSLETTSSAWFHDPWHANYHPRRRHQKTSEDSNGFFSSL